MVPLFLHTYYPSFYENIKVFIEEGEDHQVKEWVADRKVDLGCIILPEQKLDYIYLTTDTLSAVVSATHPLADKSKVAIADLCDFPFVLTEGTTGEIVMELFTQSKLRLNIRYTNIQIMSMLSIVSSGSAVSITADLSIPSSKQALVKTGSYVTKTLHPVVKREIGLAMLNRLHLSPAAAAFVKTAARLETAGKLKP